MVGNPRHLRSSLPGTRRRLVRTGGSNRDGLGTRIKLTAGKLVQYNHATTTVSYDSASDKRVHFGLGEASVVDKIELTWPSGVKQELTNVKADQILTVQEPK